jgi:hypothetical protein
MYSKFKVKNLKERSHLRDWHRQRLLLKWGFKITECEAMDWIQLAQGRDQWWALVNITVIASMECVGAIIIHLFPDQCLHVFIILFIFYFL